MDVFRIVLLEIVTTIPIPLAVWIIFYKFHAPPGKTRRAALIAAIVVWILTWRVLLFFLNNPVPWWVGQGVWLAGLAAFALIAGKRGAHNRRFAFFSAAFYTGVTGCTENILFFLSSGALIDCNDYTLRGICGCAGLLWAIAYRRRGGTFLHRLPAAYALATAIIPCITSGLLYYFHWTVARKPELGPSFYQLGGVLSIFLFFINIAVFFLYIKMNAAKIEAANLRQAQASAVVTAASQPFTLSARFIEKYGISPRQKEVVEAALAGMSDKEIAAALGLSVYTVKKYLQTVYGNTHTKSRHALTALVLDEG